MFLTSKRKQDTSSSTKSPRKVVRWKVKEGGYEERVKITPSLASVMLEYNTKNRGLSKHTIANYARQMRNGLWIYTRQPIIFSDHERLIDGQHRLEACIESGDSFEADIAFGAPDEAFSRIDIGKKRTAADIFHIHGVENCNNIASASRWVWIYENDYMRGQHGDPGKHITPEELYEFYLTHPRLDDSMHIAHAFKNRERLVPPSLAMAIHYLCARKSRKQADDFFEKVSTGVGLMSKSDPAWKLRSRLIAYAEQGGAGSRTRLAGEIIQAWNAMRANRKSVKWEFDKFPRII